MRFASHAERVPPARRTADPPGGTRMRVRLALVVAIAATISLPTLPVTARPPADDGKGRSMFDRALEAHTTLEPVVEGSRIMAGEDLATASASAALTTGVTQNGVCNDQKA